MNNKFDQLEYHNQEQILIKLCPLRDFTSEFGFVCSFYEDDLHAA